MNFVVSNSSSLLKVTARVECVFILTLFIILVPDFKYDFFLKKKKEKTKTYFVKPKHGKPHLSDILIPRGWLQKNPERERKLDLLSPSPICQQFPPSALGGLINFW